MPICDHDKLIREMEFSLNIELDPFEEDFIEELCGAGFNCKEISNFILYRRKRNSLKRLLNRDGFSTQNILDILKQYNENCIGKTSAKEVFEKIKSDIEADRAKNKPKIWLTAKIW